MSQRLQAELVIGWGRPMWRCQCEKVYEDKARAERCPCMGRQKTQRVFTLQSASQKVKQLAARNGRAFKIMLDQSTNKKG